MYLYRISIVVLILFSAHSLIFVVNAQTCTSPQYTSADPANTAGFALALNGRLVLSHFEVTF